MGSINILLTSECCYFIFIAVNPFIYQDGLLSLLILRKTADDQQAKLEAHNSQYWGM